MNEIVNPGFTCPLSPRSELYRVLIEDYKFNRVQAAVIAGKPSEKEIKRLAEDATARTVWLVTQRLLA